MHKIVPALAIAALVALGAATGASASELSALCAPKAAAGSAATAALSETQIRTILADKGYTNVRGLGSEEGCVEAKGIDRDGKRFEVYLHPATGEIVKIR